MIAAIYTLYILNCFFLILTVLLQAGRGGGISFAGGGGGGSATVFGASGASTFMQKLTVASAVTFMTLSMLLAYLSSDGGAAADGEFLDPATLSGGAEETSTVSPEAAGDGALVGGDEAEGDQAPATDEE